ncbi:putative serine/threonine-protein kinase/receptor [Tolypocladium ophioglossoides CBS 100239]|uniref:Putative serine/threonine-protein kinase/receptor n=1 Tax=Tolypocladium ophioglossoides (strain CBS 100239) TaxID=1163406 RepID=A0A0L0MWY1_TOLOC|nr:putative serine/threonine-protein kinase/receptor [Tolypocladium ophioglossoides CBS 100239]
MSDPEVVEYHQYFPHGLHHVLASGTSAFIGEVDGLTILKYPLEPGGDMSRLKHEHQLLDIIGHHTRIIAHKGLTDDGLYLELTHVHSKRVLHCDINPTNILVDEKLHIKLADFQGCYLAENGKVILPSWVGEPCRYFCPREDDFEANWATDLFALGSTMYFIVTCHEVFSDIIAGEEGWDKEVWSRFASNIFPDDPHACAAITKKCWKRQYRSAYEVLKDISAIEQLYMAKSINTEAEARGGLIATISKCIILYRGCSLHTKLIHSRPADLFSIDLADCGLAELK